MFCTRPAQHGWREVKLPMGRLRVISTYKLADGTLCREFRLQSASGAADAVALIKPYAESLTIKAIVVNATTARAALAAGADHLGAADAGALLAPTPSPAEVTQ